MMKVLLSKTQKTIPLIPVKTHLTTSNNDHALSDITRLAKLQTMFQDERPNANTNLFDLMPKYWLWNDVVKNELTSLFAQLNPQHRLIFNAVMWNFQRFTKYVRTPSSIRHHHAIVNGNLTHSMEVCANLIKLAKDNPKIDLSFMLLLALLHDAGKAEEYVEHFSGEMKLSKRGWLLGHRLTIFEWLVEAYTKWDLPKDDEYQKLLHLFTAVKNVPEYLGYRTPKFQEFYWLSCCDNLSVSLNQLASDQKNVSSLSLINK